MSIYNEHHRTLQDQFDSRRLADRLEQMIVAESISDEHAAFVNGAEFFFLSTVDPDGQPTVSFKGGARGFVTVIDNHTIAFPSYDGNGMYYSLGNLQGHPEVGLLFIDFENPKRLRFHGRASVSADGALLANYPEAELIIRVTLSKLWVNCPRYLPKLQKVSDSVHIPRPDSQTPFAPWKRIDGLQDVLPAKDAGRLDEAGGAITPQQYARILSPENN